MRYMVILTLMFLIGCAELSPFAPRTTDPSEYRMAWILTFQEDINSPESILKAVEDARAANLNAILPVAHRRGRAYYRSTIIPMFSPYDKPVQFDALQEFISCAHDTRLGSSARNRLTTTSGHSIPNGSLNHLTRARLTILRRSGLMLVCQGLRTTSSACVKRL